MEYVIGIVLAIATCVFAKVTGLDRDRAFYPTVAIVVATYYILFAAMGSSLNVVMLESAIALVFLALAVVGFQRNLWLAVCALAGHGVFDYIRPGFIHNAGVPIWWPGFCGTFDVMAGLFLALLLRWRPALAK